ncbi:MAG: radical SAM protein [Selenomonadaceae bacterium]|nr:radical SAM protein [Selenomonadaceae bacterium]
MKVAICGYPPLAQMFLNNLKDTTMDVKFFIGDFVNDRNKDTDFVTELPLITFFEFRRLVSAGELDGLLVAEDGRENFTKSVVQTCKFYRIPKLGLVDLNYGGEIYWANFEKNFFTYLETNIVDGCNLNCKSCMHFAPLFKSNEIYPIENFRHDIHRLSQCCDIITFRLLGGEPLILKNLDEYINIARQYLPKTNLHIVTNGLLIPSLPPKILDAIRENNVIVDITLYRPTVKIVDKIKAVCRANKILSHFHSIDEGQGNFTVIMSLHGDNDPIKSQQVCINKNCRFLRDGKIYKCPVDALSYRFAEKFGIENFPESTGVDLYAPNVSDMLSTLDVSPVELCHWCSECVRKIPWDVAGNPKLEDWLADPDELKNF